MKKRNPQDLTLRNLRALKKLIQREAQKIRDDQCVLLNHIRMLRKRLERGR